MTSPFEAGPLDKMREFLRTAAPHGIAVLETAWGRIPPLYRAALEQEKERLRPIADEADQRAAPV